VENTVLLIFGLLVGGGLMVAGVIYHETGWKTRRRRRLEREHARSKLR
jgi:hypothetical protein